MPNGDTVVISVGGSLIVPDAIDTAFLKSFRDVILSHTARGTQFVIITGGGRTARLYQQSAKEVGGITPEDADWLGIHATRINAHLFRSIFREVAHPAVIKNPTNEIKATEKVIIAAGWKPGWSTDYDAVMIAKNIGAHRVVNLSNIDYVYTTDPKKDPSAKPIKEISWSDFRAMLPKKWDPGLNTPFDPIAARQAHKLGLEVAVINGKKLEELENYLSNKPFVGTKIF